MAGFHCFLEGRRLMYELEAMEDAEWDDIDDFDILGAD
jgi:hypothetical protein